MKWCCVPFENHYQVAGERGIAVVVDMPEWGSAVSPAVTSIRPKSNAGSKHTGANEFGVRDRHSLLPVVRQAAGEVVRDGRAGVG
jgi:hypothetical protein